MNFLNTFYGVLCEIWSLLAEMAPYLLFGFSIAGILHVLLPGNRIGKYLSGNSLRSIVRASLIGVPLPICSCGVIPVAAHIKKQGAGNAPTLSFLTSTPTTGVDSIMATYALLGPLFAIIRPVCAFFAGTLAGIMVRFSEKEIKDIEKKENKDPCVICKIDTEHEHTLKEKTKEIFRYAFKVLLQDVGKWLVIGIVTGGMISYFISTDFIERYLGNPFLAYPIMFLIAIPLYVCATGSIPIAASLILKGMSPGAGLVFLIAGPATNTATLSFVGGKLGKKTLIIYLFAIIISSLIFGLLTDYFYSTSIEGKMLVHEGGFIPTSIKHISAVILILLLIYPKVIKVFNKNK